MEGETKFGTEKDKYFYTFVLIANSFRVNCPFYFKIGACRHGDRCSRVHHKPLSSPTILIRALYHNPSKAHAVIDGDDLGS
jgi:hypothetical protein